MIKVRINGLDKVMRNTSKKGKAARDAYIQANHVETEQLATESMAETPVDTGRLRNSQFKSVTNKRDGVVAVVGYRAEYADVVHNVQATHPVGKWKYLEDPLKRRLPGYNKRVSDFVARAVDAG